MAYLLNQPFDPASNPEAPMPPDMLARKRQFGEAELQAGMDTSPIRSPWQGAARLAQALMGGLAVSKADKQGQGYRSQAMKNLIDAMNGGQPAPDMSGNGGPELVGSSTPGMAAAPRPSAEPDMGKMIVAASDPWLPSGTQNLASAIMTQKYKALNPTAGEFGMTPVWGRDKDGKTVLMQMNSRGGIAPVDTHGVEPLDPAHFVDTGTGTAIIGSRTGEQRGEVIPKDLAGAASQRAAGEAQGGAAFSLPSTLAKAQNALNTIADIRQDPALSGGIGGSGIGGTGALSFLNAFPGTAAYDFQQKVDQLKGQAFLDAFKDLKGGGSITETEGAKATQAIARLSSGQSEAAFRKALDDLEEIVNRGVERAKAMAGGSADQPGAASPVATGGAPPVAGARQAPDGNWYVADPSRPGKYLQVQP